jgi:hypothetical protein
MMCIHQLQFLESKSLTAVSNSSFVLTRLRAVMVIDRAFASPAHSWNVGGGPRDHRVVTNFTAQEGRPDSPTLLSKPGSQFGSPGPRKHSGLRLKKSASGMPKEWCLRPATADRLIQEAATGLRLRATLRPVQEEAQRLALREPLLLWV